MLRERLMLNVFLTFLPFLAMAGDQSVQQNPNYSVLEIEAKIANLKEKLEKNEIEEIDEEVKSQDYMIADWSEYGKETQKIREKDKQGKDIQDQIQRLEQMKARLIDQSPRPGS